MALLKKVKKKYLVVNDNGGVHVVTGDNQEWCRTGCNQILDLRFNKVVNAVGKDQHKCAACAEKGMFDDLEEEVKPAKKLKTAGKFEAITHKGEQLTVYMVEKNNTIRVWYTLDGSPNDPVDFSPLKTADYYQQACNYFVYLCSVIGLKQRGTK